MSWAIAWQPRTQTRRRDENFRARRMSHRLSISSGGSQCDLRSRGDREGRRGECGKFFWREPSHASETAIKLPEQSAGPGAREPRGPGPTGATVVSTSWPTPPPRNRAWAYRPRPPTPHRLASRACFGKWFLWAARSDAGPPRPRLRSRGLPASSEPLWRQVVRLAQLPKSHSARSNRPGPPTHGLQGHAREDHGSSTSNRELNAATKRTKKDATPPI